MTSFNDFEGRDRDHQDGIERHIFYEIEHTKAGAILRARGTKTEDIEAPVINLGIGANFDKDTDTEVFLLSAGSDTNLKFALVTIPRDKQRQWKPGTGGVQNPLDPAKALEFNAKRAHVTDPNFAVGAGIFEVKDGKVYVRGDVVVQGTVTAGGAIQSPAGFVGPDIHNAVGAVDATIGGFDA